MSARLSLAPKLLGLGFVCLFSAGALAQDFTLPQPDGLALEPEPNRNGRFTGFGDATLPVGNEPWAPQVQKSFLGVDFDTNPQVNDGFAFIPPDAIGAAGRN